MKIILYSKSNFVRLNMLFIKKEIGINYEVDDFGNELRVELTRESELGKEILKQFENATRKLEKKIEKIIWKQILTKPRDCEYLFIKLYKSGYHFELFQECLNELNLECKNLFNLFLGLEKFETKARLFSQHHQSTESIPEKEFVKMMLNREKGRLNTIKEVSSLINIVNIDGDCSQFEMETKILNELKI